MFLAPLLLAAGAAAGTAPQADSEPDPRGLLVEAQGALGELRTVVLRVSHHALAWGPDGEPLRTEPALGELRLGPRGEERVFGRPFHLMVLPLTGDPRGQAVRRTVAWDGKRAEVLDNATGKSRSASGDWERAVIGDAALLLPPVYFEPRPLVEELAADFFAYEGRSSVGHVLCDVVRLEHGGREPRTTRLHLGVEDRLPRRVEVLVALGPGEARTVWTVLSLRSNPPLREGSFTVLARPGARSGSQRAPTPQPATGLLPVGSAAPDFELRDPQGRAHRLADYRGRAVVLDFWATWCGPCKRAMPGLQRLRDGHPRDELAILGINVWERGDPVAFMDAEELTYTLLLEGDDVAKAYRVSRIPTLYVVGPDGTLLDSIQGFDPRGEERIEELLRKLSGDEER